LKNQLCFTRNLAILGLIVCLCVLVLPLEIYGDDASGALGSATLAKPIEEVLANSVCLFIATLATFRGYDQNYYYWDNATTYNIYMAAAGWGADYAIVFYIGHGDSEIVSGNEHWYLLNTSDWPGCKVYDKDIYTLSYAQHVKFAFIFTCWGGNTTGGVYDDNGNHFGMPNAWLHTSDLSTDGYNDSDESDICFIGWGEEAPDLSYDLWGAENASYYFLLHFYCSALHNQKQINTSLDEATYEVWGNTSFGSSKFYQGADYYDEEEGWGHIHMVVYGDGNHTMN